MKKIVHTPHDHFFRAAMSYPRVAQQFLETYLPEEFKQIVNLDTLSSEKGTYVDEELQSLMVDMLYSVKTHDDQESYIYILVEHQSKSDPLMPFRLMKYMFSIMDDHLKKHIGSTTLPLICPIVLYNGKNAYRHTTDIFKMFKHHEALARKTFLEPFQLVDLSQIPSKILAEKTWSSILLMSLKHIMYRDISNWIEPIMQSMGIVEKEGGSDFLEASCNYILHAGDVGDYRRFSQAVHDHFSPQLEEKVMAIVQTLEVRAKQAAMQEARQAAMQEARQEARQEWLAKGIAEGMEKGKQELAIQLLQKKLLPMEHIAQLIGVSADTLLAFAEKEETNFVS